MLVLGVSPKILNNKCGKNRGSRLALSLTLVVSLIEKYFLQVSNSLLLIKHHRQDDDRGFGAALVQCIIIIGDNFRPASSDSMEVFLFMYHMHTASSATVMSHVYHTTTVQVHKGSFLIMRVRENGMGRVSMLN